MSNELVKVPEKVLEDIQSGSVGMLTSIEKTEIDSNEKAEKAATLLKDIKTRLNSAEDTRKSYTAPLYEVQRKINDAFKKATEPLTKAESLLKGKILAWKKLENDRIAKEEARRQKLQMSHYNKGHNVNPLVQMDRVEKVGSTQTKKIWKWEVTDFSKLPDDFKMINGVKLNSMITDEDIRSGKKKIPGVKFYQDEILAVR